MYIFVFLIITFLSYIIQSNLKSNIEKYSKIAVNYGLTGKDVAEKMLRENGIYDVQVQSVSGTLTDHYNPETKIVNLSTDVYYGCNVSAAAVAAHECGHAVQHATGYAFIKMRSALVPIVSFASSWVQWVLLVGILMVNIFPQLLLAGIIMFALTTLFSIITLPVEIDASRRAIIWLDKTNITTEYTKPMAKKALRSAAYTYVLAVLSSLATLLYYLNIYLKRR